MKTRFMKFTAIMALAPLALTGCMDVTPMGPGTVTVVDGPGYGRYEPGTHKFRLAVFAELGGLPIATPMKQDVTTTPPYAGDPNGTGEALITVNVGQGEVCWQLTVYDVALPATAAHIHQADDGVRGPVVVALSAPDITGLAGGCASGVSHDVITQMVQSPASFYVNVRTAEYPAGAVRAQLAR